MTVLILTSEEDVTADMVVAKLHRMGTPVVRLDPADLPDKVVLSAHYAHGDAVAAGPALLQRYIPKRADIRLTCVGNRLFAAQKTAEPGQIDGRYGDTPHTWEATPVPERIGRSVQEYLARAGLAYAAFDFAVDEEGAWWFLECNQGGQFGFVELETGQPVSEAVALWLSQHPAAGRRPEIHL
ncbi:hypothetical protein [Streptomyces sp. NPDC086766]|uniref:hypothetical protein n=1 Tax=Streptomyces sp. NPDC086766 TaxID=3365754 RepID=UPI003823A6BC